MQLIEFTVDSDWNFNFTISPWIIVFLFIIGFLLFFVKRALQKSPSRTYVIDEAEIGIGKSKIKIKPDYSDLQIAYQLWIELKTRKLGIQIEEDKDVIHEVYNSWYQFFGITRELVKKIPVQKVCAHTATKEIVLISMRILNETIRPHLTTWQAKYRRWYNKASAMEENSEKTPQQLQQEYPQYDELIKEMKQVNLKLVAYAAILEKMIS